METKIIKTKITSGVYWIEIPDADLRIIAGAPADTVKHLMRRGLILNRESSKNFFYETGPNAILLSDVLIQNGCFANLSEFIVLQMLYRQGMMIPNHPNNTGAKPLLIGAKEQIKAQLKYIYIGNYGITNKQDFLNLGYSDDYAEQMLRMKLKFAFGKIKETNEFLDTIEINDKPTHIRNNAYISRVRLNVFKICYLGEEMVVDLNLKENEKYDSPYNLNFFDINRDYFSVIHNGSGDGWNIEMPTMGSIIIFQGKIYLVDAGPNIQYTLNALGININEIEGIFHTHAHDDHFAGLPALMQSDKKIKYFATPAVFYSVSLKLAALLSTDIDDFKNFFEIRLLKENQWNNIDGLEVMPADSPHPIENTVFFFKAQAADSQKIFAHLADIIDLKILEKMIDNSANAAGITREYFEQIKSLYLTPVNLKKIDAGGGMIHGNAQDFINDKSDKIIIAHISSELSAAQKSVGSGAVFGATDIFIKSEHDYLRANAYYYLKSFFPSAPYHSLEMLLNNKILRVNPETIILRNNGKVDTVFLALTGNIEVLEQNNLRVSMISAGELIGDRAVIFDLQDDLIYRSGSFVKLLEIPKNIFVKFIQDNNLLNDLSKLLERRKILATTSLFADGISPKLQNIIANNLIEKDYNAGETINLTNENNGIWFLASGKAALYIKQDLLETLITGDFFGEARAFYNTPELYTVKIIEDSKLIFIDSDIIKQIPIVIWKLKEIYERRIHSLLNPNMLSRPVFQWLDEYNIGVQKIDEQHRELLSIAHKLQQDIISNRSKKILFDTLLFLKDYTNKHFIDEEDYMTEINFDELKKHKRLHKQLSADFDLIYSEFKKNDDIPGEVIIDFLKKILVEHIITEDRKYCK